MRRISFLAIIALAVALMTARLGYCADMNGPNDAQLDATIQEFVNYRKQQDYKGVWRLLSRRFRYGNNDDQVAYEKYVRSGGFHSDGVEIQDIVTAGSTALVTVTVTYVDNASGQRLGSALEEWTFVKENGSWFFDTYRTLSESP